MNEQTKARVLKSGKVVGKAILVTLALGGILVVGAVAPNIFIAIKKILDAKHTPWMQDQKKRDKKIHDSFAYLRKAGLVKMEYRGKQLYISLTSKGKKRANKCQIDLLEVKRTIDKTL